jgi:hypothetical protein
MGWERFAEWLDNPILVKHVRSRLRTQPLTSSIVITLVLCLLIAWAGFQLNLYISGGTFGMFLALQAVILGVMGASQVGSSVGAARASGILDFHRVSPLSPAELVLGFFFGAPVREYILFACTLPFSMFCVVAGTPDFRGFVQLMILLVVSSWVLHGCSLLNALILRKQAGSRGVVGLVVFLGLMSGSFLPAFGRIAGVVEGDPRLNFFGVSLPWLAVVLLYQFAVLFFLYLASRRKMDSERTHPFSKVQALGAMTVLGLLILGGTWSLTDFAEAGLAILYVLVIVGILLTSTVTPTQAEYYKGLWRAQKLGRRGLPFWDDLAPNRPWLAALCTLILIVATLAWGRLSGAASSIQASVRDGFPLAIANGVLVVAYFGLALQYFLLRFGRRGTNFLSLFLFLIWVVPLVAGTIIVIADHRGDGGPAQMVYAISPIAGIGLSSGAAAGTGGGPDYRAVAGAAITPSLLFTFVFNGLVTAARRRVRKAVLIAAEKGRTAAEAVPTDFDPANSQFKTE